MSGNRLLSLGAHAVSFRFGVPTSAAEFRRKAITQLSSVLSSRGWELKQQSDDALVWERRYWPPLGWGLFLVVILFGGNILTAGNGQSSDIQWFFVLIWIGLLVGCALIRKKTTLHLVIEPCDGKANVEFGGQADAKTICALKELSEGMPSPHQATQTNPVAPQTPLVLP